MVKRGQWLDELDARVVFQGDVCEKLRQSAERNHRTVQQEIRFRIEASFALHEGDGQFTRG